MRKKLTAPTGRSYRIIKKLGSGGMADVFLARELPSGPLVAIKMLPVERCRREENVERFHREALIAGRLSHPNIIRIQDMALEHEPPFFILDFAPGGSLADRIRHRPSGMEEREILSVGRSILLALDHAHRQRVIHRDIKPENILFDAAGKLVVTDFGLARDLDDKTLTAQGALLGTPYYNSPELARGHKVYDGRCDLYSLGVILYEMATGKVPFDGVDAVSVCHRHVFDPPVPPTAIRPELNPSLEKFILKALEKKAGDRYQSAADMLSDLEALEGGCDIDYDPIPGVLALLEEPCDDPDFDTGYNRGILGRFLFGTVDNPPEPAAGLIIGAILALLIWGGLSLLRPSSGRVGQSPVLLSTSATLPARDQSVTVPVQERANLNIVRKKQSIVIFPLEDRSGKPCLVRSVEHGIQKALERKRLVFVPPSEIQKWQKENELTFSSLFTEPTLNAISMHFSADCFMTGVLLRAGKKEIVIELSLYNFKSKQNSTSVRDIIRLDRKSDDDTEEAVENWFSTHFFTR